VAPAQPSSSGREGLGDGSALRPGLQGGRTCCWWYAMGRRPDFTVTPRPSTTRTAASPRTATRIRPSCTDRLTGALGRVPAVHLLGPDGVHHLLALDRAGVAQAARRGSPRHAAGLPPAPGLRPPALRSRGTGSRPRGPRPRRGGRRPGRPRPLARRHGHRAVRVRHHPVPPARGHQSGPTPCGLLRVHTQGRHGVPGPVDVAGLRGRRPPDRPRLRARSGRRAGGSRPRRRARGVQDVLVGERRRDAGLGHERAGEIVAVSDAESWFTYYYWLDDERRRTSPARWRSTASRATTRRSCS
jgi:hypothetical protein